MKYKTLIAIPVLASSLSAAVTIDNFNDTSLNTTQTGIGSTTSTNATANAIGGNREARAHNITGTGTNTIDTVTNAGQFTWSVASSTEGHFHLSYGDTTTDASSSPFAALNEDLSVDNAVGIDVTFADLSGTLAVTFYMNGGTSVWQTTMAVTGGGGPAAQYTAGYNTFTNVSGGAFNASDVDGIVIELQGELVSPDWQIDQIQTVTIVPEPSSAALLGLGGLALIMRRRRA